MEYLLPIHILAGTIALLAAAFAICSEKGKKVHITAGRTYFWGMAGIFLTALPMSIITSNVFLFLIAFFSFYLAFAGRRFAQNRKGIASIVDWIAVGLMIAAGLGMWVLAVFYSIENNSQYITLTVFGFLAIVLGYTDYIAYKRQEATGKKRIARHLSNMMGGTIAVVTAVLVVNVNTEPQWLPWVLPTLLITPVIIYWNWKVMK
ncbi:hypothetical protein N8264_00810 [Candidatus Thioglobus sp.]|nr:hypothetical protein [Candidatus Thioglobus sp.]